MTEFYTFAGQHPVFTFFMTYICLQVIFKLVNRILRTINIAINGWPPFHLDADGDFRELDDIDMEELHQEIRDAKK